MVYGVLTITILLFSVILIAAKYPLPKIRVSLLTLGFWVIMTGIMFGDSTRLPQLWGGEPRPVQALDPSLVYSMTTKELTDLGEVIIFGEVGGFEKRGIGKGQCPLCHNFRPGDIGDRAPNLYGEVIRAEERIKEPRYLHPDTVQKESFPGSGRATTADEYIAESHVCPSCYVVQGYGEKGTNDRLSPMVADDKPPISLTIEEMIAVHTWIYVHDGITPPTPQQIRADHEKFIPAENRHYSIPPGIMAVPLRTFMQIVVDSDTPEQMLVKMGCVTCHQVPGITAARTGVMGPILLEKVLAPKRLHSPVYQARVKAGKAHARTAKEYVIESIVSPDSYLASDFIYHSNIEQSAMFPEYGRWFTYAALQKLSNYLLTLDCEAAMKDGLNGPPVESVSKICH
jgi:hypothetical protein